VRVATKRPRAAPPVVCRRRALVALAQPLAIAWAGPALVGCSSDPVQETALFETLNDVRQVLAQVQAQPQAWHAVGAWNLAQVLTHAAQSIDYSIDGYPQLKPRAFRSTIGPLAFSIFKARGRMSHGLSEPIPGAPALPPNAALEAAAQRLLAAVARFEAHPGPFAPHFAYGELSREDYAQAHLLHLSNHWTEVRSAAAAS